jgi:coenzyme F420-reducing hydrogenase alpha subunit
VVTPNVDHLHKIATGSWLGSVYAEADLVVADGMPLVWASRLQGVPLPERVAGSHLLVSLTRAAARNGLSPRERQELQFRIIEPPRLFEALLRGRQWTEVPDITARICGICPVAYMMSSCQAMERLCGVRVEGALRDLRRLLYCGEWIESHALHMYLLHAPDFLGYADAVQMAKDHPEVVRNALRIKKTGNALMRLIGGREIHPINVRVSGFYSVPARNELDALAPELEWALEASCEQLRWLAGLPFPQFERDYEYVALRHPSEYPLGEGRLVSSKGLDIDVSEFSDHFVEEQVPYSTALFCRRKERGAYLVGPLARFSLNFDLLTPAARAAAEAIGLTPPCRNPFKSLLVRGVEVILACEEALRLIRQYKPPTEAVVPIHVRAGVGHGCTEAPRGILYHDYRVDEDGAILDGRIVPPTSQNQQAIADDLRQWVTAFSEHPQDKLTWECEQLIRNHDPCISCSTHFLRLTLDRGDHD